MTFSILGLEIIENPSKYPNFISFGRTKMELLLFYLLGDEERFSKQNRIKI